MSAYFWYLKRDISKTVQVRKLEKDFLWNYVAGFGWCMLHVRVKLCGYIIYYIVLKFCSNTIMKVFYNYNVNPLLVMQHQLIKIHISRCHAQLW